MLPVEGVRPDFCPVDVVEAANVDTELVRVRSRHIEGVNAAMAAECVLGGQRVELVGGELVLAAQLLNGTMMDYLVPMAAEMPDIDIGHVVTPTADSELGAKGAGEAGTAGAPACIMNAVNDALRPLSPAVITAMPITPELVLRALRG